MTSLLSSDGEALLKTKPGEDNRRGRYLRIPHCHYCSQPRSDTNTTCIGVSEILNVTGGWSGNKIGQTRSTSASFH